ncbi:MAG: SDR family NAD(P)-dependent oxidoreductase [Pseudomonadota bacterium]
MSRRQSFRHIVLTGASSGIGKALATEMAGPGTRLTLIARDGPRLAAVAGEAEAKGAEVATLTVDVADRGAMAEALREADATPIDLLIANAGVSAGLEPGRMPEAPGVADRLAAINYLGVVHTVEPILPQMIARGRGRIALMSSLAGMTPFADMPSYSASKAAVRGYGIALRGAMRQHGVGVTVICPGFVTSRMSARHRGLKLFEISAPKAARIIARGLARGQAQITFPWQLALGCWLSNRLPPGLSDLAVSGFRADVIPDDRG